MHCGVIQISDISKIIDETNDIIFSLVVRIV